MSSRPQRPTIAPETPRREEPPARRYDDNDEGRSLLGRILLAPFTAVGALLKGILSALLWPFKALWGCLLITVLAIGVIVFFSFDALSAIPGFFTDMFWSVGDWFQGIGDWFMDLLPF